MRAVQRILPMQTTGTQHLIERTYREGGQYQWVRETLINAFEAKATRVEFGIEWQAVESQDVFRRVIADNGFGMTGDELVEFFNTFGGGGKPIGGVHENFGVGAKTSLLPWNRYGVVVISWKDGEPSMIWVQQDPATGEYGLRLEEVEDPETGELQLDEVYYPYLDEIHGLDWALVKPDWIEEHGTVIVLLGNDPADDTAQGDPERDEEDIKGISAYLNRRIWEIPPGVEVFVDEFRTNDRGEWPRSEEVAHGPIAKGKPDRRTNRRQLLGARHFIEYDQPRFKAGRLSSSGTVSLTDGTRINWYLWEGDRPAVQSYAAISGYIAALYQNELYDVTAHHSTYRSFGIIDSVVRQRLWLIAQPPLLDEGNGRHGVYPRGDRNALLLKGGPNAGGPLPISDWAGEFSDMLPQEILNAIKDARGGDPGTLEDTTWRDRLADRFGSRWRIVKLRARKGGPHILDPTQAGTKPRIVRSKTRTSSGGGGSGGGTSGSSNTGSSGGTRQAVKTTVGGGIPYYRFVKETELGPGMLAAWAPNDPMYSEGAVLINVDHPVLQAEVEYWQSQYADHHAEDIENDVLQVFGQIAVAKVAHSEQLKGQLPSKVVEEDLRSEAALTMSLLGLIAEEAVIAPRIGGKYRRRQSS